MKVFFFDQGKTLLSFDKSKISSKDVHLGVIQSFFDPYVKDFKAANPDYEGVIPTYDQFCEKAFEFKSDFKKSKDEKYVPVESPITDQFIEVMKTNKWFLPSEKMDEDQEKEWDEKTTKEIYSHLEANYQYDEDHIVYHDHACETIKALKEKGYHLILVANTNFRQRNIQILKFAGIYESFDDLIFSDEMMVRKPNPEVIEPTIQKYLDMGIKRYEMAIVGNMIDRDVAVGIEAGIATIFLSEDGVNKKSCIDYDKYKPDFDMYNFHQFWHIVECLDEDVKYIQNRIETEGITEDVGYHKFHSDLPSQKMITVGAAIKYKKKHINNFIKNGLLCHGNGVKFTHVIMDVPLEYNLCD